MTLKCRCLFTLSIFNLREKSPNNTSIILADGSSTKVQNLKIGDILEGYDYQNQSIISEKLTNLTSTHVDKLLVINNGFLELTPTDQPIYIHNQTFTGWVMDPQNLQIGDQMYNPNTASWTTITSLTYTLGNFKVYDIHTAPYDNFVANGVLLDAKLM